MMKILQLCTKVPYPIKDGGAAGVYTFSQAFKALRHTSEILAVNPPKHFINQETFLGNPEKINIHAVPVNTSPKIIAALLNLFSPAIPYTIKRFIDSHYRQKLIDILQSYNPDIVQIEGLSMCPYISTIRQHSRAKIVLRAHNIEHILWNNIASQETNVLKKVYFKIQAKRIKQYEIKQLALVDGITAISEQDSTILQKLNPAIKSVIIPFGLPKKSIAAVTNSYKKEIFFIGALDWVPNQEAITWFLKNIWSPISEKFPESTFHIAGRNTPTKLSDLIQQTKGVKFHGEVADSSEFMKAYTFMVVPLFSGSGIRVKIIEAMQHGKVVIASPKAIEGIPAVPGKHFLLANDETNFIEILTALFSTNKNFDQLSLDAQLLVKKSFNILTIASDAIDFFNSLKK